MNAKRTIKSAALATVMIIGGLIATGNQAAVAAGPMSCRVQPFDPQATLVNVRAGGRKRRCRYRKTRHAHRGVVIHVDVRAVDPSPGRRGRQCDGQLVPTGTVIDIGPHPRGVGP